MHHGTREAHGGRNHINPKSASTGFAVGLAREYSTSMQEWYAIWSHTILASMEYSLAQTHCETEDTPPAIPNTPSTLFAALELAAAAAIILDDAASVVTGLEASVVMARTRRTALSSLVRGRI